MKLSLEAVAEYNQIHSYHDDRVVIRQKQQAELVTLTTSFILMPEQLIMNWPVSDIESISDKQLIARLLDMSPEVILFASGSSFNSSFLSLLSLFSEHNIGCEFLSLGAACRTYNLLCHEDRQVMIVVFL